MTIADAALSNKNYSYSFRYNDEEKCLVVLKKYSKKLMVNTLYFQGPSLKTLMN